MKHKNLLLSLAFSLLSLVFLYGCATIYNPATGKREFILIDTRQETSLGKALSRQIEAENEKSTESSEDTTKKVKKDTKVLCRHI